MSNNNLANYTRLHILNILRTRLFIDCGLFFGVTPHLNYFRLCHCQHILHFINTVRVIALSKAFYVTQHFKNVTVCQIVSILIFDGLRLSGIEKSNYIESNNFGRKSCPVSRKERIRYSGCLITLKIEGKNSGPRKSSGFKGIPVLRGSGLEGFYCIVS